MKKKVIRVIARLNVGGPAIHVILLTSGLNPEKYQTLLVSGKEGPNEGNMFHIAQEKGVDPVILPNLGRELDFVHDLSTLWQLYSLFRKEKPDIVHTHTAKAGTVGRLAAWLAGVPVIVHTFHGHVLYGYFGKWKTDFFRWVERSLARLSSTIIAVSEQCRQDLIHYGISNEDHIRMIPLGLELDKFTYENALSKENLRQEWGVPKDAFLTGIVARMVPIKRHKDLFEAVALILPEFPDAFFAVIGDGELREELEGLAKQLGIAHRVIFTGFRNDTQAVYQALDLTVLTSANEGLPVTVIESLSSGKAVVATNVGGVPELIEEGQTGYIVQPKNPKSIADGLKKALADPRKTSAMGKIAQEATIARYSSRRLIQDIESLYEELSP